MFATLSLSPRHWALSVCAVFVLFLFMYRSPTKDFVSHTLQGQGQGPGRSCSNTLASQVQMLRKEYAKQLQGVTHVARIGFGDHSNKGDSAIWVGESMILEGLGIETVYICIDNQECNNNIIREQLQSHGGPKNTAIMFCGGGNFGDVWHKIQQNRELVAIAFPEYRIRSFPQTYKFNNDTNLARTQAAYGSHPDLQLTVRDTKSFLRLQNDFGSKHIISLLPDAATMLSESPLLSRPPKKGDIDFLFLARVDGEGAQDHNKDSAIFEELQSVIDVTGTKQSANTTIMDWLETEPEHLEDFPLEEQARMRVEWSYDFLGQGSLILADRLHAHIMSTVWGFDHITVEDGAYAKLRTYHDTWLLGCGDRVVMTQSVREAVNAAKRWYVRGKSFS